MNSYAFTLENSEDGPTVDWFADITPMVGSTLKEYTTACEVAAKLEGVPNDTGTTLEALHTMITLRSRFTAYGRAFKVTIDEGEITREDLNTLLRRKVADGTLRQFLESATI